MPGLLNKRVLGITLARGGSMGIPNKNIAPINGIPLIAYTIAEAHRSHMLSRYIVSTDDTIIADVASAYGAEVPFSRPAHLATDSATSADALQHAVHWAEDDDGEPFDYIVDLMCTNPMKTADDIDGAISKLIRTDADSVIGVSQLKDNHPCRVKQVVADKIKELGPQEVIGTRRQDLRPKAFIRNGSIYAIRRDALMKDGLRYGHADSRPWIMPEDKSVNIDDSLDLRLAEVLFSEEPRQHVQEIARQVGDLPG